MTASRPGMTHGPLIAGLRCVTVQRLAGHRNVQTTARYGRQTEAAKGARAAKLHVPYRPPAKGRLP